MLQGRCAMKRLCKPKRLNRFLLSGSSFWLLHTATRLLHQVFNLHHPAWVHIVIWYVIMEYNWYVFVDVFYQWYQTKSHIYIYLYHIYMHMYHCVVYASNLCCFLISWPDFILHSSPVPLTAHPFRLHLWAPKVVRGRDGHVDVGGARGQGFRKLWRLQGCLSLSNLASKFIQVVRYYIPPGSY